MKRAFVGLASTASGIYIYEKKTKQKKQGDEEGVRASKHFRPRNLHGVPAKIMPSVAIMPTAAPALFVASIAYSTCMRRPGKRGKR